MKDWPNELNILGKIYKVEYVSDPQWADDGVIDHGEA